MKLKMAVRIGKDCGLRTLNECIINIEIHCSNFFVYPNVDKELAELNLDIEKLSKDYGSTEEEILKWTICEYNLYV